MPTSADVHPRAGVYEDGPLSATAVPIMPAWVSLGDYDNIFSYHKLAIRGGIKPSSMEHLAANHDVFGPSAYPSGKPRKPADARARFVVGKGKEILGELVPSWGNYREVEAKYEEAWAVAPAEEKAPFEAAATTAAAEHATALAAWQEQQQVAQLETEARFLGQVGKEVNLEEDFGIDSHDKLQSEDGCCMGLRCCLPYAPKGATEKPGRRDMQLDKQTLLFEAHAVPDVVVVLPGGNDYAGSEAPGADADADAPAPLFHLDSSGKACFSAAEAKTASAPPQYIRSPIALLCASASPPAVSHRSPWCEAGGDKALPR